jgi:alpha-beta hydrolase superfamily lysophospholipase/predicted small lipoprotein YifL
MRVFRKSSLMVAVIVALSLAACGSPATDSLGPAAFTADIHTSPISDADFYATPSIVPRAPGVLLRAAVFPTSIAHATGWKVMFTSNGSVRDPEAPTIETGIVLLPDSSSVDRPVAVWGHPTTGIASACAPSRQKVPDSNIVGAQKLIDSGWIVAAPDFEGLGIDGLGPHPYMIGDSLGRAMLDIVRATEELPEARRSQQFAAYGHSEGGQAALFAGQLASSYAPELHLTSVAAMAPSGELDQIFREDHTTVTGALLGGFLGHSWSKWFFATDPELPFDQGFSYESLFDHASWKLTESIAASCSVGEPSVIPLWGQIQSALDAGTFWRRNPGIDDPWARKLKENSAGQEPIPVPVLLTVGSADDIVSPAAVAATDARYRANGTDVTLRTFAGGDHMSGVSLALRDVLSFLQNPPK